jgi:O-antigen/teichoic acid export membrane protein
MSAEASAPTARRLGRAPAALFLTLRGRVVRRLGWGVADQAVSSLTNVAVTLSVVRTLGAEQFGAFSLAYVTYAFALTASRGLATDPLIVRFSGADLPTWRRAIVGSTGTAAVVGMTTGACVLAVAAITQGTIRHAFLALGLMLPGLLLQDSWRYAFFTVGRGAQAFLNDVVWALALLPALMLVWVTGQTDVFWFIVAWGAAASVAAAVGSLQAQVLPRLSAVREWLSQHRDLGLRYLAEGTTVSVANQMRTYGVGLMLGLAAVGYVQAAYTLMGPLMIMLFGTVAVIVPEIARVLRRSPRRLPLACLAYGGSLAAIALAWGVILLAVLPKGLGDLLLGEVWRPAYPLVPLVALAFMGGSIQAGAGAGLRALGAARRSLRAMILSSVAFVVFGLVGAAVGGTVGTVLGAAVAAWIGALLWWWQLHSALQESVEVPAYNQNPSRRPPGRHRRPTAQVNFRQGSVRSIRSIRQRPDAFGRSPPKPSRPTVTLTPSAKADTQ